VIIALTVERTSCEVWEGNSKHPVALMVEHATVGPGGFPSPNGRLNGKLSSGGLFGV
jgi:hypothetical protein